MAHSSAIAVISRAPSDCSKTPSARPVPNARFLLVQGGISSHARPVNEGVTVFLYRLAFSSIRRSLSPEPTSPAGASALPPRWICFIS
jgi:hypothetical protein